MESKALADMMANIKGLANSVSDFSKEIEIPEEQRAAYEKECSESMKKLEEEMSELTNNLSKIKKKDK